VRNEVQLITYADRLAGDLPGLNRLLTEGLADIFGGVHVLPFGYPIDGADAGFDPIDQRDVDERIGNWADVAALGEKLDVCADLIVNHASRQSPWFQDIEELGERSPYQGMFLSFDQVFPDGATEADLLRIYRPRPGLPLTQMTIGGEPKLMWTTFTSDQVDLDLNNPRTREQMSQVLELMSQNGISCVRLDAVGYAIKTPGTSCFMTPQTTDFIRDLTAEARTLGLDVLVEVHAHYERQQEIARVVDLVYDFALPPLVLHAIHAGDVEPLLHWLRIRPVNAVTVLDTHDGIGVIDVVADHTDPSRPGLLTGDQVDALVESIHTASAQASRRATGTTANNLDIYQVNCTWYDAVGRDDVRMCISRMIQLLTPGIPQIYYVGLLAGVNDEDLLEKTGVGRDINRHRYTATEVAQALAATKVKALIALIRLRNTHPAFTGRFACGPGDRPGSLFMTWHSGAHSVDLTTTPGEGIFKLGWTEDGVWQSVTTVQALSSNTTISVTPAKP
jgi:sucrose phosphorylase